MDVLICKIKYPNDPSGKIVPHQHFVGCYKDKILELYSISSIAGKEYKIYDKGGMPNPTYYLIIGNEYILCNLKVPSFIDCAKSYRLNITDNIDINKLSHRVMPKEIVEKIKTKIKEMKDSGNHVQHTISSDDFITHNTICKIK
ncbi:hypothetical protein [Peptostreptococcus porci]|uniref:hypothetical protein n=1 Tax=Peptostreptococcus porci TaxID=2652282 RepID=UPI002A82015E|nr:hypothetical protein [Peptostreptococcus porci]MDY4128623.1 hypothetical protein [Peptostreptococcus porci]MDY5435316.1 hypothetical protein [Peptostreptococcus porci]MDY6231950.1 hypothetical protein [Peptostreptococcus porci]